MGCGSSYPVLPADQWARQQFAGVRLGDGRLTRRTVKVAAAMAADPSASIPQQNKLRKQVKGAYRLFDHDRLTFESVSQAHWQQTRELAGEQAVVLLLQDTTDHTFASHPGKVGLGRCGKFDQSLGLLHHSVLAIAIAPQPDGTAAARVLGLAWGKLWAREAQAIGRRGPKRTAHRCSPDRESTRWLEALRQIGAPPCPAKSKWLHVTDREGDIFDLHEQATHTPGLGFLVRIKHLDRSAVAGHDAAAEEGELTSSRRRPRTTLQQVCRAMPELTRTALWIAPGGGGRSGRWAEVAISGGPVTIYSPWYGPNGSRSARPLRCGAVRVWEPKPPPAGVQPLEWLLLTSEPINGGADARRVANYYELRWLIEEYHRCLKSGCKIEARQLESADRLAPFIGIASAVATRLLQLKNDARLAPQLPAKQCVEPDHLLALCRLRKLDPNKLTVRQFTHEVAALGGFLGRKRDGEPGWLTLWRGWRELDLITLGFQLATTGPPDVGNG